MQPGVKEGLLHERQESYFVLAFVDKNTNFAPFIEPTFFKCPGLALKPPQ